MPMRGISPYMRVDREGRIAPVVAMMIGGAVGGGIDLGLQLWNNGGQFACVDWWSVGGSALAGAAFGGAGRITAGTRGIGKEFSHFIPHKLGGPKSVWNGNYVSISTHARSDPFRRQFMSRAWKSRNGQWGLVKSIVVRLPRTPAGLGVSGSIGATRGATGHEMATDN